MAAEVAGAERLVTENSLPYQYAGNSVGEFHNWVRHDCVRI